MVIGSSFTGVIVLWQNLIARRLEARRAVVTGEAGYVCSHAATAVAADGRVPVLCDDLCNARRRMLRSVPAPSGRDVRLKRGGVWNPSDLGGALGEVASGGVVHLAGLKPGGAAAGAFGWRARTELAGICADCWRWQSGSRPCAVGVR